MDSTGEYVNAKIALGILLIFVSATGHAQSDAHKVQMCPGLPDNSPYRSCGAKVRAVAAYGAPGLKVAKPVKPVVR